MCNSATYKNLAFVHVTNNYEKCRRRILKLPYLIVLTCMHVCITCFAQGSRLRKEKNTSTISMSNLTPLHSMVGWG